MKRLPTRKEAAIELIKEARREKRLKRSYAKTSVALMVLGLDSREVIEVLSYLDLCSPDGTKYE